MKSTYKLRNLSL